MRQTTLSEPEILAFETYDVYVGSECVVVDVNPENADMDNPRGERYGESFFLTATNAKGYQFRFGAYASTSEALEAYEFDPTVPPVSEWFYFRCVYGSEAYVESDQEAYLREEELEDERYHYMFKLAGER